jgi:hypothetical protein
MFFVSPKLNKNKLGHLLTNSFHGFSLNGFYLFAVLFSIVLVDLVLCYTNFVQSNQIRRNASTSTTGPFSSGRFKDVDDWKIEIKSLLLPITGYVQELFANCFYFLCLQPILHWFDTKTLANLVTLSYTLISIPQIWLLSNVFGDNGRQIACLLFQIRNILDYVDGKVIRNGDHIQAEFHTTDSNEHGRLIDAAGNVISLLCFFTGSFSYIWKSVQKQSHSMIHSSALSFNSNTIHVTRNRIVILNITLFLVYFIIASAGKSFLFAKKFMFDFALTCTYIFIGWNMVLTGYMELVSRDKVFVFRVLHIS